MLFERGVIKENVLLSRIWDTGKISSANGTVNIVEGKFSAEMCFGFLLTSAVTSAVIFFPRPKEAAIGASLKLDPNSSTSSGAGYVLASDKTIINVCCNVQLLNNTTDSL
uniref:Fiber protein n=1 Tax=Syphacia muris TaxID=451379 RepID=A0A0N5AJG9_9BILA